MRAGGTAAVALMGAVLLVGVMRWTAPSTDSTGTAGPVTHADTTPAAIDSAVPSQAAAAPGHPTMHYISNTGPQIAPAARLGFNLFDLGPDESRIDALGPGQQALVWLGNLDNTDCTPNYSWSEFTASVDRLAHDPKVFGYYISDEPHPSVCAHAVADIRARADYIHAHAPGQKSFIVLMDSSRNCGTQLGCEYRELGPVVTHVDLYGIDPFPCRLTGICSPQRIDTEVGRATDGGIPVEQIVPVFQVFGQTCSSNAAKYYGLPSASEFEEMLDHWSDLVPDPVFDFAYTWNSGGPACPSLDRATNLQAVVSEHNRG